MEHLLNLLWVLVGTALFASAGLAHRRARLRCSLSLALGCTALLVLLLFPALSMTDDLQRARLDVEQTARHLGSMMTMGTLDEVAPHAGTVAAALLLLLFGMALRKNARMMVQRHVQRLPVWLREHRPQAVRPPPPFAASLLF